MKLYFHPLSGNSRRVLLTATHLDVPVEKVVVDLTAGEQKSAAHLARNPNGKLPALEDGDLQLWESRAIMQYLCELTPGQTLYPSTPRGRADVNRWLSWCNAHMAPALTIIVQENFVKPLMGRPQDAAELARGEALFHIGAKILDAHLAGRMWVAQDHLTLADFSLASGFALAKPAKMPLAEYAHITAWLARVQELDAWKRTAPQA
ncbi:MAG TPA: glutathione S-transferase family protein [Kofleriaceae bacterium]|jgi:glutathione S-transferase